ncbi:MAG TPA: 4-hydroxythreonine-4-phosphate dehydrogenase PdxA [Paralcaligenes sp.]
MNNLPVLGLMLGDMTGIGPEISARLLSANAMKSIAHIVVIGDARVLELGRRDAGVELKWKTYNNPSAIDWSRPETPLIDLGNIDPATIPRGAVSPESGKQTGATLKTMIDLALGGEIDAVCFAPLNKAALHKGGWNYHDEHQMFADLTQHVGFFGEMNVIKEFATFRVTSHVALREALAMITTERVMAAVRLANTTLRAMGRTEPRLAVAALNPHAGEGGLFGDEEIRIIQPALERLRAEGVQCSGPVPSDVVFIKALKGDYDGVITMYHDQGQIATKLLGFNRGVTVTAGLKTVFATPAHGTAFDIVGQGKATTGALEQALRIAANMATARKLTAA